MTTPPDEKPARVEKLDRPPPEVGNAAERRDVGREKDGWGLAESDPVLEDTDPWFPIRNVLVVHDGKECLSLPIREYVEQILRQGLPDMEMKVMAKIAEQRKLRWNWLTTVATAVTIAGAAGLLAILSRSADTYAKTEVETKVEPLIATLHNTLAEAETKFDESERKFSVSLNEAENEQKQLTEKFQTGLENLQSAENEIRNLYAKMEEDAGIAYEKRETIVGFAEEISATLKRHGDVAKVWAERVRLPVGTIIAVPADEVGKFVDSDQWVHPSRYDPTIARWTLADGRIVTGSVYSIEKKRESVPQVPDHEPTVDLPNKTVFGDEQEQPWKHLIKINP